LKRIKERPSRGSGLSQSEIAGKEEHYYNNTHYVENIVHVSSSFLFFRVFRVIGFTVEPTARNIPLKIDKREASVVVLPPDAAPWSRKFTDVIHIEVLHTVDTLKPLL